MMTCPRCSRADTSQEVLQSRCVDKQTIGCPNSREIVPGKDIIITCRADACDKQFAVPVASILNRRSLPPEVSCMRTPCEAVVLLQPVAPEDAPTEITSSKRSTKGRQPPRE